MSTMFHKILIPCVLIWVCCVECKLNLRAGAPCTGADGIIGRCVNLYKCPSAVIAHLHYNFGYDAKPNFPEVCNDDGAEPVVCCTDCYIDEQERSRGLDLDTYGNLVNLRERPVAKAVCLKYFRELPYPCEGAKEAIKLIIELAQNRTCHQYRRSGGFVLGGRSALSGEFPHAALLGYGSDIVSAQWHCGGTVISESFILTAAHCTSTPYLGPVKFVSLEGPRRSDPIETWKIHTVKRAILHPQYESPAKYHDIALLELDKPINFSRAVLPACLQTLNITNDYVQGIGWGRLGPRQDLADTLQVVDLIALGNQKCDELNWPYRLLKEGYDETTQICYGNPFKTADTCTGDSGGPLQVENHKCQYTVVAVTSGGDECGKDTEAGLYTRVLPYVPWIERIVWPHFATDNNLFDD